MASLESRIRYAVAACLVFDGKGDATIGETKKLIDQITKAVHEAVIDPSHPGISEQGKVDA